MGNSPSKNDPLPNKSSTSSSGGVTCSETLESDEPAPALSQRSLDTNTSCLTSIHVKAISNGSTSKSSAKTSNSSQKSPVLGGQSSASASTSDAANVTGIINNVKSPSSESDEFTKPSSEKTQSNPKKSDSSTSGSKSITKSIPKNIEQPSSSSSKTNTESSPASIESSSSGSNANPGSLPKSAGSSVSCSPSGPKPIKSKRRNSRKSNNHDLDLDLEIGASMAQLLKTNNLNYSSSVDSDSSSSNHGSTTLQDEESSCSSFGNSPANMKFYFKDSDKEKVKNKDVTVSENGINKMDSIAEISNGPSVENKSKSKKGTKESSSKKSPTALSKTSSSSSVSSSPPLVPVSNKKFDIDIDSVIERLLEIASKKPHTQSQMRRGKDKLPLSYSEIKFILGKSRQIFLDQPTLLQLSPPVKIVGDIHGQFHDLVRIFNSCGYPPYTNYLFLGDYVDRGYKSLETILLLLSYKIKYPENFFMLRGNHECANITKIYGFYDECKRRLPAITGSHKLWKNFVDVFNTLPIGATINNKILCIHGGLSPELHDLRQIEQIKRPTDIPDKGLLADLLWSDPDPSIKNFSITNWPKNDRGVSYCFGRKHVDYFCQKFKLDLIVRGHMVVEDGYEFFNKRKLVTVFSAPNYCGEFNNFGAIMSVDQSLYCSFDLIKPQ